MLDFFSKLFDTDFMPHGHCYYWQPAVVWLHVISDAVITLSYYSIPVILIHFVRRRRDLPFHWMFIMFGMFIFACGTTHLMEVWTLWIPAYRISGLIKALTAAISALTAVMLAPLIPKALSLPSIEAAHAQLRRTAADLERSNKDLEQFAYVASHDLQEPLRMVASYTQLLHRRYKNRLDADADEFIGYVVDGAMKMQELINHLLAHSQLSTRGKEFEPTDCNEILEGTLAALQLKIHESNATVTHDPLPSLMADPTQLSQLFQNLIGNSLKFRGTQPPRIHISAKEDATGWLFSVQDNGIGIDPHCTDEIFKMFARPHGPKYPGGGIGLAICKKIVERHGGSIWVQSREGQGAIFYFTLSRNRTAQAHLRAAHSFHDDRSDRTEEPSRRQAS